MTIKSTKIENNNDAGNKLLLDQDGVTVLKTMAPGEFVLLQDDCACEEEPEDPEEPDYSPLESAIATFNTAHASDKVPVGGPLTFISDSGVSGGGTSAGRTFVDTTPANMIRQHGHVTAFDYVAGAFGLVGNNWKFKLFRPDGTDIDQTVEDAVFTNAYQSPVSPPLQRRNTAAPMACVPGDMSGVWMLNVNNLKCSAGSFTNRYNTGDLSSLTAGDEASGYTIDVRPLGPPPFLALITDSLGCHGTPFYRPAFDGGISGDPTGDLGYKMRELVPSLTYQNLGKGSQGWAYGVSMVPVAASITPKAAVFLLGVNDRLQSWATTEGRMNACKAGLSSGCKMLVCQVMPDSSASDSDVAIDRALNTNMAAWCAANGATLILCRDAMGQTRSSTGQVDDLLPAYDAGDGIHHNATGKAKLAQLIVDALNAITW